MFLQFMVFFSCQSELTMQFNGNMILSTSLFSSLTFAGDNFFKSVSYTIEVVCAEPFTEEKENLRAVEAQILSKRVELSKFETEYREVCAPSFINW